MPLMLFLVVRGVAPQTLSLVLSFLQYNSQSLILRLTLVKH
jgi:hypothetical protein